jgi:S-adenosylmethionine:diacylglycerol 3-amino-3-carboxypropyl transferase
MTVASRSRHPGVADEGRRQPALASIARRADFEFIRYGSVWEDADVLCEALAPAARGGRVLSVASAGDNVLALLALDPAEVVAADLSAAQLACLELRMAAFRACEHPVLLAFLGVRTAGGAASLTDSERVALYRQRLRPQLGAEAAAFWDARLELIAGGIVHGGKFERYFHIFRGRVLPLIHGGRTVRALLAARPRDERVRFYERRWNTWRWRLMFRAFFSRAVMGRLGRDPEFFAHVDGPVGDRILARTRHALTEIPTDSNPWLAYILTGNFGPGALPPYLRAESFPLIRARLDRVRLERASIERAGEDRFDAFNLSDVFEYMSPAEHQRCYGALLERARPGARLAYWNMLAPRSRPEPLAGRVEPLRELADALHVRDRAWFYQRFHVDQVRGSQTIEPAARQ